MASQSSIAEDGKVVSSDELDFEQKWFSHSSFKFNPQFPNNFGQPINLGSSQIPVVINIPPEVFNIGNAIVNYTVNLPGVDGEYIWTHRQALKEISHIQWYSGNSMYIVDIDNLQNYEDITLKRETERDEFLSLDPELTGVGQSNSVVNVVPALRNSNITTGDVDNGPANPSSVNYTEPGYFSVGPLGNNQDPNSGTVSYNVSFPLHLIKNSFFSCKKEIYCSQTTYLKIYFGPLSKICYTSSVNTSPSDGVKDTYQGAGTIENLQLMLPIETNQNIRTMLMNKVATSGLKFVIPYTQAFKNNNRNGSQTISIQFDITLGKQLQKVIHSVYNTQENLDTAYDHSNNTVVAGVDDYSVNQKVLQYYTALNGARQQDLTLDCTPVGPYLDYLQNRKLFEESILSNLNVYQYNWHHCDDYTGFGSEYSQHNNGKLLSGIPMTASPLTWSFYGLLMRGANNDFYHYTWGVFAKVMSILPTGQILVE